MSDDIALSAVDAAQTVKKHILSPHPLFPPLPTYPAPATRRSRLRSLFFRATSFVLSLTYLLSIVVASLVTSIPGACRKLVYKATLRDHRANRPLYTEQIKRTQDRKRRDSAWHRRASVTSLGEDQEGTAEQFKPTEGGKDPIVCDVGYYARRVGLDVETFKVVTEDGFHLDMQHVVNPNEPPLQKKRMPVLLMHGLLQSSGAFCCNDDASLAFWLAKAGFDVWLGNNRCGFVPGHETLHTSDPRMWAWSIRDMGVYDLSALVDRVREATDFEKIGLVCHSQGTTQTFVALAKDQRPELGEKISVFCALAPAVYAGPLLNKIYLKFVNLLPPKLYRLIFGMHAFIPFMMTMHSVVPPRLYGWLGYKVFSFLFDWSDNRWDRGLRNRQFQFAPVYVSAEAMRWWLGRDGFARHGCILATKETCQAEEAADAEPKTDGLQSDKRKAAWYDARAPPMAFWVCGRDELVDGRRWLRRLENGREPLVTVIHKTVIEEYEHLDVLWAMDAPTRVFEEVKQVLWRTCPVQDSCVVPEGCE